MDETGEDEIMGLVKELQAGMARLQRRLRWMKDHEPELYKKAMGRMAEEFKPAHKSKRPPKPVLDHVTRSKRATMKVEGTKEVIAAYCEEFKARYGTNPAITAKAGNQIKNVVKSLGVNRSMELIRTFVWMNKSWFITKMHSVDAFVTSLNEVAVAHDKGIIITKKQSSALESLDSTAREANQYLQEEEAFGR